MRLVEQFRAEYLDAEAFNAALDALCAQLEGWHAELDSTESQDNETWNLVEDAKECMQMLYDGVDMLRLWAENGDDQVCQEGLEKLRHTSEIIIHLIGVTEDNLA